MTPAYDQHGVTLYTGDAIAVLRELPDGCVQCVVTSPPYWALRDYGTATWEGGDAGCDHRKAAVANRGEDFRKRGADKGYAPGSNFTNYGERNATASDFESTCGKCGARRIDKHLALTRILKPLDILNAAILAVIDGLAVAADQDERLAVALEGPG